MKKTIIVASGLALLGLAWLGKAALRSHDHLVTLRVRNAALAEVVRNIERQTSERIPVDKDLEAVKVTLEVKNMPLADVLDLLCDQTCARWSETFAVYGSGRALPRLESVLRGDLSFDVAGWTNATAVSSGGGVHTTHSAGAGTPPVLSGWPRSHRAVMKSQPDGSTKMAMLGVNGEVKVTRTLPDGSSQDLQPDSEPGLVRALLNDGDGGPMGDGWNPTQLVLESSIVGAFGEEVPSQPSPECARQAAERAHGKWKTYYVIQSSPWPAVIRAPRFLSAQSQSSSAPGTVTAHPAALGWTNDPEHIQQEILEYVRQNELRMTPEQRVQRARQQETMQKSMAGAHSAPN